MRCRFCRHEGTPDDPVGLHWMYDEYSVLRCDDRDKCIQRQHPSMKTLKVKVATGVKGTQTVKTA